MGVQVLPSSRQSDPIRARASHNYWIDGEISGETSTVSKWHQNGNADICREKLDKPHDFLFVIDALLFGERERCLTCRLRGRRCIDIEEFGWNRIDTWHRWNLNHDGGGPRFYATRYCRHRWLDRAPWKVD